MSLRMPSAKQLVGRTIVGYDPGLSHDSQGHAMHNPTIYLDNGTFLRFMTEEAWDGGDYGTYIIVGKGKL